MCSPRREKGSRFRKGTLGDGLADGEAIDRVSQEFLHLLQKGKLLVVWVVDRSASMNDDREDVAARIERVYTQVASLSIAEGDRLLTGVVSYGDRSTEQAATNHTPTPTADRERVVETIRGLASVDDGAELQCPALQFAIAAYRKRAEADGRKLVVFLVSDESGDRATNESQLESTITLAKEANCSISVVGHEAIFGSPYAMMSVSDPATKKTAWHRINRGPETPDPEQLQFNGYHRRTDAFPSGFGPYEQSRLARMTGGIFYMFPKPEVRLVGRDTRTYDADVMRRYLPDLSSREAYRAAREASPFRAAVWKVIADLDPYRPGSLGFRTELRLREFSIDPEKFAVEASAQVKKADELIEYLAEAEKHLEQVAALREEEKSRRWRANYDLLYAQVVGYQALLREYSWYMSEFVKNPKPVKYGPGSDRPNNSWYVRNVPGLRKPEETLPQQRKAELLFRKVEEMHPGTPWSERAGDELKRRYGIELWESALPGPLETLPKF